MVPDVEVASIAIYELPVGLLDALAIAVMATLVTLGNVDGLRGGLELPSDDNDLAATFP